MIDVTADHDPTLFTGFDHCSIQVTQAVLETPSSLSLLSLALYKR